eukprot:CAMPEP_0175087540 /NCGR_PEP_ID=MMETSP0052_2-20121109/29885_1 /TAXON_ID=51329 ORGANISM="Polytomella parva, Strain SAG 63-3" /NCGR_SAMPLE_ID=MMETSP0052_2 /ASSEMBLY_ACC=CAM_ASM_000194 /LENGTH=249 /DNA_ID=CAMNT_0016359893 /DNA_START=225 /DNA_END=970 /DNA_ORIENTATION=+
MRRAIEGVGPSRIAAIVSTTSCFAPRASDDVLGVAILCAEYGIPHMINNAYGVQSRMICRAVNKACLSGKGRVDLVVQSTDKNFMVPVGGSIVAAPAARKAALDLVATEYPGRASASTHLDLMMTLLNWGARGWRKVLACREELFPYLLDSMKKVAAAEDERVLDTPGNPISVALTLDTLVEAAAAAGRRREKGVLRDVEAATVGEQNETVKDGKERVKGERSAGKSEERKKNVVVPNPTFFGSMLWSR